MNLCPLLFSMLLVVPACSSSSPGDSTGTDAGHDAASDAHSTPDTGDAASATDAAPDAPAVCNTLVNSASSITVEQVASDPPAPQGGTPVDGTYALTAAVIYTGPDGPTGASGMSQTTLQITGATIQVVSDGDPATRTITFTTSGTSIASVDTCPDTDTCPATYTATPTTFIVAVDGGTDDAGARTLVETFTKE
jgi:hypothetical protein